MKNHWRATGILLILVLAAAGLYLKTMNPARFGFYHDDGIYVVTAKALATGHGYRIISLPHEPAQTKYPPIYPFLLSLIWRGFPTFPDNLWALQFLSVVMAVLFLTLSYAFLVRRDYARPGTALLIVALMAFNRQVIFHAASLQSELTYMVFSLLTLWFVERYTREDPLWLGGAAGLFSGLSFLTRSVGITLIVAAGVWFLAKRQYKKMVVLLTVSGLLVLPWIVWQSQHHYPDRTPAWTYYTDYLAGLRAEMAAVRSLPSFVIKNLFYGGLIFTPVVSLSLAYEHSKSPVFLPAILLSFALIVLGFLRRWVFDIRPPDVYVAFYFGLVVISPYNTSMDRYLLPLLPFLLLYMITQAERLIPALSKNASAKARSRLVPATFMLTTLIIMAPVVYRYLNIFDVIKSQKIYQEHAQLERPVWDWVREHTAPTDVILAFRDPLIYLYTGRHAMNSHFLYTIGFYSEGQSFDTSGTRLDLGLIWDVHADYLILMASDFSFDFYPDRLRQGIENAMAASPQSFTPVYGTPRPFAKIYRIRQGT